MHAAISNFALLAATSWVADHWGWLAAAGIVFFALFVIGPADVMRFSWMRVWAISGVCFSESIRKRVLWVIPLAVLAVLVVDQFQAPVDDQDAVRQTIKFCLFATGLVVVTTSLLLACTNLPKEIESRVIFTIVTKPTTRLEVILGKIVGFGRVSLTIVAIMGVLTWAYLRLGEQRRNSQIETRINEVGISDTERARLAHYKDAGLLTARSLWQPNELAVYARIPDLNSDQHVITGPAHEEVLEGFLNDRSVLFGDPQDNVEDWAHSGAGQFGLVIQLKLQTKRTGPPDDQPAPSTQPSATKPAANAPLLSPKVEIDIFSPDRFSLISPANMVGGSTEEELAQNIADYSKTTKITADASSQSLRLSDQADGQYAYAWIPPQTVVGQLFNLPMFNVRFVGGSAHVDYSVGPDPVRVFVPKPINGQLVYTGSQVTEVKPINNEPGQVMLAFRGRQGIHNEQDISGNSSEDAEAAVFQFRDAPLAAYNGQIPFEIQTQVDRSDAPVREGHEDPTILDIFVADMGGKSWTKASSVLVESRQTAFFNIPADLIHSGNFFITVRCRNDGHQVGLFPNYLQLVTGRESFEMNLVKSLAILWLMSFMVVSIAILCSTFLSWPIAVVLTLVLLLGHWGVTELADSSGPGLGRQIVNDFKMTDAPVARVVSTSVDALSHMLTVFSQGLPDTSQFDVIEDIEQGISVSADKFLDALEMMAGFSLPAMAIAYCVFRYKEVAP